MKAEIIGEAVAAMTARLAEPRTIDTIKTLLSGLTKNKQTIDFDQEFAQEYGTLSELVWFALEVNFSSFLSGNPFIEGLAGRVKRSGLGTSIGGSGG